MAARSVREMGERLGYEPRPGKATVDAARAGGNLLAVNVSCQLHELGLRLPREEDPAHAVIGRDLSAVTQLVYRLDVHRIAEERVQIIDDVGDVSSVVLAELAQLEMHPHVGAIDLDASRECVARDQPQ